MNNTLLLTACIQPSWSTPGKSSENLFLETREQQYLDAICYYIEYSDFTHITICDNSNYDFAIPVWQQLYWLAKNYHKHIELLSFDGNKESHIYGYGYGEAEIFDYAFEYSQLLKWSTSRYKITGRYIVKDINTVLEKTQHYECFFQKQWLLISPFTVSTAVFKISNNTYQQYLHKKQIRLYAALDTKDYKGHYYVKDHFPLERVWYCLLTNYLITSYQNINNIAIVYLFPQTYTHGVSPKFRNMLYQTYVLLWWSQFNGLHCLVHHLSFHTVYTQAIADGLF
jgi:hypothetical protein